MAHIGIWVKARYTMLFSQRRLIFSAFLHKMIWKRPSVCRLLLRREIGFSDCDVIRKRGHVAGGGSSTRINAINQMWWRRTEQVPCCGCCTAPPVCRRRYCSWCHTGATGPQVFGNLHVLWVWTLKMGLCWVFVLTVSCMKYEHRGTKGWYQCRI